MQHPESHCMEEDEYPELIKDPYGFISGTIVPRLLKRMGQRPERAWMTFYKAMKAQDDMNARFGAIFNQVSQKYGFYRVPGKYNGKCVCPIDQMTSQMRGFTGMLSDVKRRPELVREAAEAMLPLILKRAEPAARDPKGTVFMPLHMASYMRPKEFETIYWPTFYKLLHGMAEKGHSCYCFCESNWERYVDFLQELPQFTRLHFEYGDPKKIKDKLGDKFILTGFYPLTLLRTGTREQCVDKAKELLDILAPGGNYYFDFDKGILTLGDIVPENLYAVIDYIVENSAYPNAGQPSMKRKTEDTIHPCLKDIPPVVSSHYTTREQFAQDSDLALENGRDIMFAMMEQIGRASL